MLQQGDWFNPFFLAMLGRGGQPGPAGPAGAAGATGATGATGPAGGQLVLQDHLYVSSVDGDDTPGPTRGSIGAPYQTLGACLTALGVPTSQADYERIVTIDLLDDGTEVADVTVPTRRIIIRATGGRWHQDGKVTWELRNADRNGSLQPPLLMLASGGDVYAPDLGGTQVPLSTLTIGEGIAAAAIIIDDDNPTVFTGVTLITQSVVMLGTIADALSQTIVNLSSSDTIFFYGLAAASKLKWLQSMNDDVRGAVDVARIDRALATRFRHPTFTYAAGQALSSDRALGFFACIFADSSTLSGPVAAHALRFDTASYASLQEGVGATLPASLTPQVLPLLMLAAGGAAVRVAVDGTAAAPALTLGTTDDPDTGWFHPAANTIAAAIAGAELLRMTANGLGIGLASPSISFPLAIERNHNNGARILVRNTTNGTQAFSETICINSDGNSMAMGVTAPGYTPTPGIPAGAAYFACTGVSAMIGTSSAFPLRFATSGVERGRFTTAGVFEADNGVAYTPATPANWVGPAPTTLAAAIDRIANVVSLGGGTPIP